MCSHKLVRFLKHKWWIFQEIYANEVKKLGRRLRTLREKLQVSEKVKSDLKLEKFLLYLLRLEKVLDL